MTSKSKSGWRGMVAVLLVVLLPLVSEAKTYSSGGGRSYSSSSSRSYSSGRSHSSGSSFGSSSRGYNSGKSYSSGSGRTYSPGTSTPSIARSRSYSSGSSSGKSFFSTGSLFDFSKSRKNTAAAADSKAFSFDTTAARAQKEAASKREFSNWKQSSLPAQSDRTVFSSSDNRSGLSTSYPRRSTYTYIPAPDTFRTRTLRIEHTFNPYYSRPLVVYRDPYNSFFWWWLLDRSLDQRAMWAYHHQADMDAARYQALLATDTNLEARVHQLEAQQVPRDPNYVPPGMDRDLMYTDQYVNRAYQTRPTPFGRFLFFLFFVPAVIGTGCFLVWLVFVKRWQTAA